MVTFEANKNEVLAATLSYDHLYTLLAQSMCPPPILLRGNRYHIERPGLECIFCQWLQVCGPYGSPTTQTRSRAARCGSPGSLGRSTLCRIGSLISDHVTTHGWVQYPAAVFLRDVQPPYRVRRGHFLQNWMLARECRFFDLACFDYCISRYHQFPKLHVTLAKI